MDELFQVRVLSQTERPQFLTYQGMHQCYSPDWVGEKCEDLDEAESGKRILKHLLAGGRGHFGPLEAPAITLSCGYFPHSTMQQMRTHRVGLSFNVQSFRYTGQQIMDVANGERDAEEVFYLRPVGEYRDRQGVKYDYAEGIRAQDVQAARDAAIQYRFRIANYGYSEEHARGLIPFDVRQHWDVTVNARSLMHLLDLRWKADAQLECQQWCELVWPHFELWMPDLADWYEDTRAKKARLAP